VALAPSLAVKAAAGLAIAFAVAHADRGHSPQGRTAVAVSRAEGNRWVVTRSSTLTMLGEAVERTCASSYSFRRRHWRDLGCRFNTPSGRGGASRTRASSPR
jgi:hypothetical protein